MEPLLMLRRVREVSAIAKPDTPETVSQRAFDEARAASRDHAELPPARRIAERLELPWREVLEVAHAHDEASHNLLLGRKGTESPARGWLTPEYVAFALSPVARRLENTSLTPGQYRTERNAMLRADRGRWLHGRQLLLPNDDQIRIAAGTWDAALKLAELKTSETIPRRNRQPLRTRVEVMERFYDYYREAPSYRALYSFARGNGIPMSEERRRRYDETVAEWLQQRRDRGLPPPRVVRRVGRGHKAPDFSRDVGAAQPGEHPYRSTWADLDTCVTWIARYLATLGPRERSTQRGYDDWARRQTEAPRAERFARHVGWEVLRRRAQELLTRQ